MYKTLSILLFSLLISGLVANAQKCVDHWHELNESEDYTARHECSFVQAGESFIMFGGRESAQKLEIFDYQNNIWSVGGAAPKEFNHFQATFYKGFVWVIGSYQTNKYPSEKPADFVWLYFPPTRTWIQACEIPEDRKRGGAGLVVYEDKFYLVSGSTNGHDGGYTNKFDEYDPYTNTFVALKDAPHERDHFHAAIIDGKLYAAGGRLSGGEGGTFGPLVKEMDVYDFKTELWTSDVAELPTPRAAPATAVFKNELYLMGGEGEIHGPAFKVVEAYNPVNDIWKQKADMNHPRHGTQAIVSGDGIYVAAGSPVRGGGRQHNMEVYGEDSPKGKPIVASKLIAPKKTKIKAGNIQTIKINNKGGNTGCFINSIELVGEGFTMEETIENILIDVNSSLKIPVQSQTKDGNATLKVRYNGNNTLDINLEGK